MDKALHHFFVNDEVKMSPGDWGVDVIIALGSFGIALLQLTASADIMIPDAFTRMMLGISSVTPTPYGLFAVGVTSLPVILRRRYSWLSYFLCLVAYFYFDWKIGDAAISMLPLLLVLGSLAAFRPIAEAIFAGFIAFCVAVVMPQLTHYNMLTTLLMVQNVALIFAVTGAGVAFRSTKDRVTEANLRAEQAEETAKTETRRRLEEERVTIARELHDITAHSLSAISIQAAAAEAQMRTNVDDALASVKIIRKTAKDSLNEIRNMIGVLRDSSEVEEKIELAPSTGTESLGEIKTYLEAAGVSCSINVEKYERSRVAGYVDVALYGIAREAATNIVKHAHASRCEIVVATNSCAESGCSFDKAKTSSEFVKMTITDNGVGVGDSVSATNGHGVEGMRERVCALQGKFSILNALEGGTVITIMIPILEEQRSAQ